MNNCPIKSPSGVSNSCPYSKEGLCDYPYEGAMSVEQIKETTRKLKGGRRMKDGDKLVAKWRVMKEQRNREERLANSLELAPPAWWWLEYKYAHRN